MTRLCDGGAVGRCAVDLAEAAGDGGALDDAGALEDRGALEDGEALEDGRVLEDGEALEDGGVVSGGAVLLVCAIGAACGCGVTPDSPPVVLQPVITTTAPVIQASSRRIRITHLAEFSIGDRPPRAKGSFGRISPKSTNIRVCLVCSPALLSTSQRAG